MLKWGQQKRQYDTLMRGTNTLNINQTFTSITCYHAHCVVFVQVGFIF